VNVIDVPSPDALSVMSQIGVEIGVESCSVSSFHVPGRHAPSPAPPPLGWKISELQPARSKPASATSASRGTMFRPSEFCMGAEYKAAVAGSPRRCIGPEKRVKRRLKPIEGAG